jgi:hypothetical protein
MCIYVPITSSYVGAATLLNTPCVSWLLFALYDIHLIYIYTHASYLFLPRTSLVLAARARNALGAHVGGRNLFYFATSRNERHPGTC